MSFSSNPFFINNTLRRCLGTDDPRVHSVTTDIQWKDTAHKLTVKEVKKGGGKKSKKGSKGKNTADDKGSSSTVRIKPCASFFRFFLPDGDSSSSSHSSKVPKHLHDPVALQDDEEGDEGAEERSGQKSAKLERDALMMKLITEEVLPKAAELYMSGPLESLDSDEDGEGDEGDGYQLIHGAAGLDPSELPGPVQPLLAALRHNQAQIEALQAEREQLRLKAKQQEEQLRKQLSQQRRGHLLPPGSSSTVVPRFWLRVLRSADAAALAVSPRDAAVLAHLADIRFSLTSVDAGSSKELHGKLELDFLPNTYLKLDNPTLIKEYSFEATPGGEPYLLHSKVTAAPLWSSPELDPTHKKGRDSKQRPASSIFQLFKQGGGKYAFNLSGSEKDVQAKANELETELLMELHGHLLIQAGTIYQQVAQEGWPEDDSPEADKAAWQQQQQTEAESSDSDEEVVSDDEGEAAHRAAARRAKQKQHGWRVTKAGVLMGFLVLVLLAEVFVFLDMTGLFGRSKR
eukprot:GHUV01044368.1.p1 GENE.GHUV01044368.1~~GHUV01044368.1.p1  ORF type:complete len:515 (+),score=231.98 GHUV01044368.1:220-1764(+)